ncbi:sugar phosphate nucleotidyltransferase [Thermodesulfobacteriota bacterium]
MKAMILAAGFGERLLPYTRYTPKPLFTLSGRPLLDIIIRKLQQAGCKAIMINTHHLSEQIETFITEQHYSTPIHTRYEPQILGTGGGVKHASDFFDDAPFFVINSDIVFDIDLNRLYRFHLSHTHPATLVLFNNPALNSVMVNDDGFITDFQEKEEQESQQTAELLTFTGIQVIDPVILDFIPSGSFSTIIDAYRKAESTGLKICAYIPQQDVWNDIGTPKRYQEAAFEQMAPEAFQRAYPLYTGDRITRTRLAGDGSDRIWHRLHSLGHTLILSDHGIRKEKKRSEIDAFVDIGRHLFQNGLPVPKIVHFDRFSGLVFLKDLGDVNLQSIVGNTTNTQTIVKLYQSVIDRLIKMSVFGARGFDVSWTYQTDRYDKSLILEKECRYFVDAFLTGWLNMQTPVIDLYAEFEILADRALFKPINGFMHRDMQSRNIMKHDDQFYFIDFQGGRIGPLQYDLASLLIDPYVDLPQFIQDRLLGYAIKKLSSYIRVDEKAFIACFNHCAITRNLQILGAFGFLSRVKRKKSFENYIPAAIRTLSRRMKSLNDSLFPVLTSLVKQIQNEKL